MRNGIAWFTATVLTGCIHTPPPPSSYDPPEGVPSIPVVNPAGDADTYSSTPPLRDGFGRIEAIAPDKGPDPRRITLQMEDTSRQSALAPDSRLRVGERVQVTVDGRIKHAPEPGKS